MLSVLLLLGASSLTPPATSKFCLYYLDSRDGNLYRSRVDGSKPELVIRCKAKKSGLQMLHVNWPRPTTRGLFTLGGIPGGSGWTSVDASPKPKHDQTVWIDAAALSHRCLVETGSLKRQFVRCETGAYELEPNHRHERIVAVVTESPTRVGRYEFRKPGERGVLGAVLPHHVLIQDGTNVVSWDLATSRAGVVVQATEAVLWPRDLSKKDRFVPVARYNKLRWKVKSPDDIDPKKHGVE